MLIEIVIENEFCPFSSTANLHYEKFSDGTIKCLKDEIPFEVPAGWIWCRLKNISTTNIGLNYHPEDINDQGVAVLRSNNIKDNVIDYSDLVKVNCAIKDNQYLNNHDILICSRNGSKNLVGKCAVYEGDPERFSFGAFMAVLRTSLYEYVYYYLLTNVFRKLFHSDDSKQINQVTQTILKEALIPLPPFQEQSRISSAIKSLFSYVDSFDANKKELTEIVSQTRSKILDLAIRGKLVPQDSDDEPATVLLERIRRKKEELIKAGKLKRDKRESVIFRGEDNSYYEKFSDGTIKCIDDELPFKSPKNWMWCELQDCCSKEIKRGRAPKYADEGNVLAFAQKCNRKTGEIDISTALWLDRESTNRYSSDEYMLDGDIVINSTGTGTLGRIGIYRNNDNPHHIPIVPDSHVTVVRAAKNIEPSYLFFYLKFMQRKIEEMGEGSTNQKELKPLTIQKIRLPIPPYEEQQRIVKLVHSLTRKLSSIEEGLTLMH